MPSAPYEKLRVLRVFAVRSCRGSADRAIKLLAVLTIICIRMDGAPECLCFSALALLLDHPKLGPARASTFLTADFSDPLLRFDGGTSAVRFNLF